MTLLTWVLFALVLPTVYLIWFRMTRKRMLEISENIPGPPCYPFVGSAHLLLGGKRQLFKTGMKWADILAKEKIAKAWIGPRLAVAIWDPNDVEVILSSHVHIDKAEEYRFFQPWLGNGLLISTGEIWRNHRRLIAPTFHLNVLKKFIDLFNKNSAVTCEKLRGKIGTEIDVHDYMSEATVEILLETAMGVNRQTQKGGYEYAMAVMKMCEILHLRQVKPWLRPDVIFSMTHLGKIQEGLLNTIHSLTNAVIKKRKEERIQGVKEGLYLRPESKLATNTEKEQIKAGTSSSVDNSALSYGQSAGLKDDLDVDEDIGEKKRVAFLDLLLEAAEDGVVLSDREVKEQVDTIMFEGHDTTAAGSSFFLSLMGIHQDIQEKCVEELREIFGDSDRAVTFQDTLEMKYLERCIMETLRLYPPVPIIARRLNQDVKSANEKYTIPAGTTVVVATFLIHRDPVAYPNPEQFNPDNFLPEKCANRHYYSFIPFSAGPRSCVGRKYAMLKLKILLSTILRNYKVVADGTEKDFQLSGDIILKRAEGFKLRLEPRKMMKTA